MSQAQTAFVRSTAFELPGGEWFDGAGLGLFVHWDQASQQGLEVSWPLVARSIIPGVDKVEDSVTIEQYQSTAATFDPAEWDAAALARHAKDAGATYVVFTARHHAGYNMFFTEQSEFGVEFSPIGRDITREFVDAVRAEGLRVGIYYSLPDWNHPDYPAFTVDDLPYAEEHWPAAGDPAFADSEVATDRFRRSSPEEWSRYLDYVRAQLTELLTNYGTIDLLWFDGDWERSAAEWTAPGLRRLIKSLQPDVIINDRLPGQGDYRTPEQAFPATAPDGPWELCLTIGEMWGWRPGDTRLKSSHSLAATLVDVVSRGGNLLLNVGPRGDGSLPETHVERLTEIADWMQKHRESVIGVSPTTGIDFFGPSTARPGTLYLHLVMQPVEEIVVRGLPVRDISGIRLLQTGEPLDHSVSFEVHSIEIGEVTTGEIRIPAPAPSGAVIDVIAIDFS
ncbi:alpha-L-fucosidase [Compostimonas suwonensis]|uniref:alpha-L-fucosidase n=1 Tax=Compostimonas suwonensis TaxID=1048394 RepID=A0A2M9BVM5_9MICO|nr:alpha-L-fucosidase [Compostimonas suwonensis]PJJ61991.1 alpha-L-fucosidase [Compostimonas suwonensis]